jgi:hypothetical protein
LRCMQGLAEWHSSPLGALGNNLWFLAWFDTWDGSRHCFQIQNRTRT